MTLLPGIVAPHFSLLAANQEGAERYRRRTGRRTVLIFFPSALDSTTIGRLAEFQASQAIFETLAADLVGISNALPVVLRELASRLALAFPLLMDEQEGSTARAYGVLTNAGEIQPTVFVLDDEGLIRRVYEANAYPNLPAPAQVLRALAKLSEEPRLPPITDDDWQRGPISAPVTIVEYADYECGPCQAAHRVLKELWAVFGDRIRLVHRHFPLRHSHPHALLAAEAAEAAGAQGRFWEMHDKLFDAQGDLARERIIMMAADLGLDVESFSAALDTARYRAQVEEDFRTALRYKIKSPPTLFVNGITYDGPRNVARLRVLVEQLIACSSHLREGQANPIQESV